MFTLRFIRDDYQLVVAAKEYAKDQRKGMAFIIANSTEYQVGGLTYGDNPAYDVCFVENQAGKTIDRVAP